MRDKVYMPRTAVEITYPEGTEIFIMVEDEKNGKLECCEIANKKGSGIRFSMPLNALVEGIAKLPQPVRKMAAMKCILEISKAGDFDIPKEIKDFPIDAFMEVMKYTGRKADE